MEKLKKKLCIQEWGKDLVMDILGALLYGAGISVFAVNANFAPGGITGLAILVNHFFPFLPIGTLTVLINIPVILLCYAYLGKKYLLKSIVSMGIIAFVLDVIYPHMPAYTGDPLLAALFAGVLSGVGLALIYARGYCTGGSDFVIMAIRKKFPHLSVGSITLIIDGAIILAGGFVFGRVDAVLQGIVMTGASTV
ncbi:MAG: YitT family protein, partial [Clostridia bacterium]|nr:YitT family protein [Clostridia bacterium]